MMPHKGFNYERLTGGKGYRWTQSEGLPIGPGPLGPTYASWLEARHPGAYEAIYEQRRKPEYWDNMTAITNVLPLEEYVDYWVAQQSMEFLSYPGPKPFFLWCGFCGPHAPIDPPEPYNWTYPLEEMPLPKSRSDDPPRSPKGLPRPWWGEDTAKIRRWRSYYYGLTTLIDDMLGWIMALLERRGLWENTLVILTSDHGDMAGDYNLMEKGNFYEEVTRVPLIVAPPGGCAAKRIPGLVETIDIAPTILDYAGVPVPPQMAQAASLRPLLEGGGSTREAVLCEHLEKPGGRNGKCIRTARFKYITWGRGAPSEFYDLEEDPDEQRNLYGDAGYAAGDRAPQGPDAGASDGLGTALCTVTRRHRRRISEPGCDLRREHASEPFGTRVAHRDHRVQARQMLQWIYGRQSLPVQPDLPGGYGRADRARLER